MPGRHVASTHATSGRAGLRHGAAALLAAAGLITGAVLFAGPATAATDSAQLTLTGLSDNANPAGGSQIGVHPGDYVKLGASAAPTTQAKTLAGKLGLSSLLSGLLGTVDFQVKADFSRLPGGAKDTVLKGGSSKTFHFTKTGTYTFTWQAEKVTTGLLGKKTVTLVTFDGNQAKKLGIELNASNTYVGSIVVATNPPKGGLSVQLPKTSVKPKVGNVNLPKVTVPGVNLPTARVSVPDLMKTNKNKNKNDKKSKSPSSGSSSSSSSSDGSGSISNQALPVPLRVLNAAGSGSGGTSGGGGSGYYAANLGSGVSPLGNGQSMSLGAGNAGSSGTGSADGTGNTGNTDGTGSSSADRAAADGAPSAQLPIVLAIVAIVALALVGSAYARMFLLRGAKK